MNRRSFAKMFGSVGLVIAMGFTSMGVSCSTIFNQILGYIGVGLQAFQSVINLLAGAGIIIPAEGTALSAIVTLVKAGFADLQLAVQNYNDAPASQKTTLEGKISVVLSYLETQLQSFWNGLSIPDPNLSQTVEGLIGIILSTLSGFGLSLPPAPPTMGAAPAGKRVAFNANRRTTKQFKSDFNAVLVAHGYAKVF